MKTSPIIKPSEIILFLSALCVLVTTSPVEARQTNLIQDTIWQTSKVSAPKKTSATVIEVPIAHDHRLIFDFYSDQIFRLYDDNVGGDLRELEVKPAATILADHARKTVSKLRLTNSYDLITITTSKIKIEVNKHNAFFRITNLANQAVIAEQAAPVIFEKEQVILTLKEHPQEYFYGGGVQNGRFSHKGKMIAIENQNRWTDGGVASPAPFYWSTQGYGSMWHTFKKGKYDFGAKEKGVVKLSHETNYLDVFFMVGDGASSLLKEYYQLTGNPVLLPKFGFYEGHLNAYNRDFWKEDTTGIMFEDGKHYKESQKDNGGIKESLNGEKE